MNRDHNAVNHRAMRRSGRHLIGLRAGSGRNSSNSRTGSGNKAAARPSVGHILVNETIEIGVQRHHLTLTELHLVSRDLDVGTELRHLKLLDGDTTAVSGSSGGNQGVVTRRIGVQRITSIVGGAIRFRPNIGSEARSSGQRVGGLTGANHVVTNDSKFRNIVNIHLHRVGVDVSARIVGVMSGSPELILTIVIEISGEEIAIDIRNLNAVHKPSVGNSTEGVLCIVVRNGQSGLVSLADVARIRNIHLDSNRLLIELNRHSLGSVGAASAVLEDSLDSIRVASDVFSGDVVGIQIVNRVNGNVVLEPNVLILGIFADRIDSSLKRGAVAFANHLGSDNHHIRNRIDGERVNRSSDGSAALAADFHRELVRQRSTIIFVEGIHIESQMGGGGTSDVMTIGDVLAVHHPLVGVAFKVVIDNSGKGHIIVLASIVNTFDVGLHVNHGGNSERLGNADTTVGIGNRNHIDTVFCNIERILRSTVAPSV